MGLEIGPTCTKSGVSYVCCGIAQLAERPREEREAAGSNPLAQTIHRLTIRAAHSVAYDDMQAALAALASGPFVFH